MSTQTLLMAATDAEPSGFAVFMIQAFPFIAVGLIIYFLIFRPQQLQMKQHKAEIAAVKKGDEVVTGGGLRGRVTKVAETEVEVEIAQGVKVKAIKSTLSQVLKPNTKPAND
jgi:preprotein translocase subunit YajC